MCTGCVQQTAGISRLLSKNQRASVTSLEDCTLSLDFLKVLREQVGPEIKPYVSSQISVYHLNCNLYVPKIQAMLDAQIARTQLVGSQN